MSRILLVDDSPHAQRIGERILTGEGFEVVTVSNADTALVRIDDVDPDVVIADTVMPGRTGYEICQYLKMSPRHRHVRVILTAGVLEPIDEAMALRVQADETLKKPFEATALVAAVQRLAAEAVNERKVGLTERQDLGPMPASASVAAPPSPPFVAVVDAEQIRAAVTVALDASMDAMANEISRRVLAALQSKKPEAKLVEVASERGSAGEGSVGEGSVGEGRAAESGAGEGSAAVAAAPMTVRRVNPFRVRSSILGLEAEPSGSE